MKHIYLAAVHPSTRPSLSGMFSGRVDREWARHHHPKWVAREEAAEQPAAEASQVAAVAGKLTADN